MCHQSDQNMTFKEKLTEQLDFIQCGAEKYDEGNHPHALHVANAIRVLLHDTHSSTSLLSHLNKKAAIQLVTLLEPTSVAPGTVALDAIGILTINGIEPDFMQPGYIGFVSVDDWWNQVVLVTGRSQHHTRRSIVLGAANFDGGAHVDPRLDTPEKIVFKTLQDGYWTFVRDGESDQLSRYHLLALRQFAHELLNSPDLIALAK